jgi:hypothetical protein
MNDCVGAAEAQNQDNHGIAAPDPIVRAAETPARGARQQGGDDSGPDGGGETGETNGVDKTVGPQQPAGDRRQKGDQRGFKAPLPAIVKLKQIRQIIKQASVTPRNELATAKLEKTVSSKSRVELFSRPLRSAPARRCCRLSRRYR